MTQPLLPPELGKLAPRELLLNETFLSIQGESTHAGRPCFFIRLAGCHLRCVWCDSEYAFHEGRRVTVDDCVELARRSGVGLIEVTGGEPLLQKACLPLLSELCEEGFEVLLETSGAVPVDRVDPRVARIIDWKAPGSGMEGRNDPSVLADLRPGDEIKVVLAGRADYEWTRDWLTIARRRERRLGEEIPVHLSPVFGRLDPAELARWILEDALPARLNLQLHKLIWSPDARGV